MSNDAEPAIAQTSFKVEVISEETDTANQCAADEIEPMTDFDVGLVKYEIGVTGEILIAPTWSPNSMEDCPFKYIVYRLLNGGEEQRRIDTKEAALIALDATSGSVRIEN